MSSASASGDCVPTEEAATEAVTAATKTPEKVEVRLQAAGDAPIMKQKNYKVDSGKRVQWVIAFIRKYLKLDEGEQLFVYVNQAFAPSPDRTIGDIYSCFGMENKLVLYYSKSQMWG